MKKLFFIESAVVAGLLLHGGLGFAYRNPDAYAQQGQAILKTINEQRNKSNLEAHHWVPTGPTAEDIRAANKVENLAVKGSLEDQLIAAVKAGDLKKVENFIAAGAGLEARDNEDMTALMIAAKMGYTDIVSKLINAGANVHAGNKFGMTAFFMATDKNHVDITKTLMTKGAAAYRAFEDVFMSSVFKGNTEMVKALMVESARIKHDTLKTAYMIALNRRRSNPELFDVIVEALNKKP